MSPRLLALLRIATGLVLATTGDVHSAPAAAGLDAALHTVPFGVGWLHQALPFTATLAHVVRWLTVVAALLGAAGAWSRSAFAVAAIGYAYLSAAAQLSGAAVHNHHLLWLCVLLAASPCGDALSVDAWRRGSDGAPATAYAAPIWAARALIACVYGFPGLWKLLHSGYAWTAPETLEHLMHWKWMQAGRIAWLRLDQWPGLLHALAIGVLLFEVLMPLWVTSRRTRPFALVGALLFHLSTAHLLFIRFETLFPLLVALLDEESLAWLGRQLRRLTPRWRRSPRPQRDRARSTWPGLVVGGLLVIGAGAAGATYSVDAWPFACYPPFDRTVPETMPVVRVETWGHDGVVRRLPPPRGNREWSLAWQIAGAYGDAKPPHLVRRYAVRMLRQWRVARGSAFRVVREEVVFDEASPDLMRAVRRRELPTRLRQ